VTGRGKEVGAAPGGGAPNFAQGGAVRLSLAQPADRMTASAVVLMASLSMPVLMHWATVPIAAYSSARSNHGAAASGIRSGSAPPYANLGNAITNADGRFQLALLSARIPRPVVEARSDIRDYFPGSTSLGWQTVTVWQYS
jgi:hypothetical protein